MKTDSPAMTAVKLIVRLFMRNRKVHKMFDNKISYYRLDNSRIWSVADACFVTAVPDDAVVGPCPDEQGNSTLEGLVGCLDFYGYPKGELKTDAEFASEVRTGRDKLLAETDFMMMSDYPLSDEKRQVVSAYRQALRDIPEQSGFPRQINWPEKNF